MTESLCANPFVHKGASLNNNQQALASSRAPYAAEQGTEPRHFMTYALKMTKKKSKKIIQALFKYSLQD